MGTVTGTSLAAVVFMLVVGSLESQNWDVSYCVLKGASITLSCSNKYPKYYTVVKSFWFVKEPWYGYEPVDISEEEEYKGRVQYIRNNQNEYSLRIDDLRESDAGKYKCRFYIQDPTYRFTDESKVTLKVTDLKVELNSNYLICSTTCILPNPTYIWYKNGQLVSSGYKYKYDWSQYYNIYACATKGNEKLRSTSVCVSNYFNDKCWSVSYSNQNICALVGSSVDIEAYYSTPDLKNAPQLTWHKQNQQLNPVKGQVEILNVWNNWSILRLNNVTSRDSSNYKLTIIRSTRNSNVRYNHDTVSLSVTDLTITMKSSSSLGVTLHCSSSCELHNTTYIWFRNGQRVTRCTSASCQVEATNGSVSYSCSVNGHDKLTSAPVYTPTNTSAAILSSKELEEGNSVIMTCNSMRANPPVHKYSWYKREAKANRKLTDGQEYNIANVTYQHSGSYYCSAFNPLGQQMSTDIHLNVLYSPKNTSAVVLSSDKTLEGNLVTLVCSSQASPPVLTYHWFKRETNTTVRVSVGQNYSITNVSSQHSGLYYCTALHKLGQQNSTPTFLNVLYPPGIPLLTTFQSTSPNSITLRCESDANPASSYSWYRKTPSDVNHIGNGTNITLSAGYTGVFCEARNQFGSKMSEEWSARSDNQAKTYTGVGFTVIILLIVFAAVLWIRKRRKAICSSTPPVPIECANTENNDKDSAPLYGNILERNSAQISFSNDQTEVLYSSVHFAHHKAQGGPLNSTVEKPLDQKGDVVYAVVSLNQPRAAQSEAIYSTVQRI